MMTRQWWIAVWASLTLMGCGGAVPPVGAPGSDGGATPGGAQDIALARRKIAEGRVPLPEDFVVEGLFAEHDLPLAGPKCEQVLCLRTATGIATALDTDRQEVFVQVGMSSGVDMATFHRKPLDAALVIDHSGSMSGEPMEAVKEAARRLVGKLNDDDTLSVIMFDDTSHVLLKQSPVKNRDALLRAIDTIQVDGGTCIECGLADGYKQLATLRENPSRARRVFLFTDAMPNVGQTDKDGFMPLVREHSLKGRDLTLFGVNIVFGQSLSTALSSVRGSNSFYLSDTERTRTVFDEDFDYLVTPIAYDLKLALTPGEGFQVEAVYGLPGVEPGEKPASLEVSTVFLSRRRGAIVARLSRKGDIQPAQHLLSSELSFTPVDGEAPAPTRLMASYGGSEPLASNASWYSEATARKTVALTNFALGARAACDTWGKGDKAGARKMADRTAALLHEQAEALDDAALRAEARLASQLAELMAR